MADELPISILVIDDDPEIRRSLQSVLETSGYHAAAVGSGKEGLRLVDRGGFDLVLCDLRLPDTTGMDVVEQCSSKIPVILMTAFGDVEIATRAAQSGAYDYLSKPLVPDDLIFTLRKFEEHQKLKRENKELRDSLSDRYTFSNIIAKSDAFKEVFETVKRLSQFNTTILITGESGTGKELLARAVHENSQRRGKPFVAINCGAIPENLMESELFGHKKGAFTDASRDKKGLFEEAQGGTLFLDEVGELPLHLQVKLLRALQERVIRRVGDEQSIPIDVRVISATLRNLEEDVRSGRFRDDLFYRLNVVSIHLPPLRERPEDIPVLVDHFIRKHCARLGLPSKKVTPEVLKVLTRYPWRGNARELENCIERGLVLSAGETIEMESLPDYMTAPRKPPELSQVQTEQEDENLSIKQQVRDLEIRLIKKALKKTKNNRTHAARILEISHRALLYKLKEYEIGSDGSDD
jgi:two-component system response regulator AtoC